jgi:hypothetical protein
LQITDRIKLQGTINLIQAIITTLIIAGAFFSMAALRLF